MKIYYDNIIYNYSQYGGVATYWRELTSRVESNLDVRYINAPKKSIYPYAINLLKKVDIDIRGDCTNIFHSSYYRLPKIKCFNIVSLHDFTIDFYGDSLNKIFHKFYKYKCLKKAHHIICVSNNTKKDLLNLFNIDSHNVSVVYHGVSDYFFTNTYINQHKSNLSKNILYVGKRDGYKNFQLAINTLSILKDFKLLVLGGGKMSYSEIRDLNLKLKNRWEHINDFNIHDLKNYYTNSYALLYTSNYEGFGMPILESMAAGCPVICQDNSSLKEVGGDAALYSADDPYSVIKNIYALSNNEYRNKIIHDGLINAKKFSWDNAAHETIQIYKKFN